MLPHLSAFTLLFVAISFAGFADTAEAQAKADPKAKPAAKVAAEPATPEVAAKVLDLRKFPVMEGAKLGNHRTLAMLMYSAKGTPKDAYAFQKQNLEKLGFKELPGGYSDAMNQSGRFTKDGFLVQVSIYTQDGEANVTVINGGNVLLEKLPVPPGATPFHPEAMPGTYLVDAKVADVTAACRKLLLDAGWERYGQHGETSDESSMECFKRNAIMLQAWVSTAPAQGNKTMLRYSTELFSVDLPAPPEIADPRYTDFQKTLNYDAPLDQEDAIIKFYQERMPKLGWKATTEKPIGDDVKKTKFLIFRNAAKELLSLDLTQFTDIVRVKLSHLTAEELAAEEAKAKEAAKLAKEKEEHSNRKVKVVLTLPPGAGKLEQDSQSLFEFTMKSGSGPKALGALRDQLVKDGWKEEKGAKLDKNTGDIDLKKDEFRIGLSYFDTGITDCEIRVSGPKNIVFEPAASKEKPPVEPTKPGKKPKPSVPGLPELPPGVDLPDDVGDLIKNTLKEAEGAVPPPPKTKPKR